METYAERLRHALSLRNVTQQQLADTIGVKQQSIGYLCKLDGKEKKSTYTPQIAQALNISSQWLATGAGPIDRAQYRLKAEAGHYELSGGPATITHNTIEDIESKLGVARDKDLFNSEPAVKSAVDLVFARVPKYDIELSAGHGSQVQEESGDGFLYFRKDWIERKELDENNLCVVYAKGHSMEPTINDGDVILIDTSEYYTHRENVDDGFVYAINLDGEAMVKRLFKKPGGGLIVRSDSPAPQYRDLQLGVEDLEYLRIIGRSIWRGGDL